MPKRPILVIDFDNTLAYTFNNMMSIDNEFYYNSQIEPYYE